MKVKTREKTQDKIDKKRKKEIFVFFAKSKKIKNTRKIASGTPIFFT